jgi:hypothetical protein
MADNTEAALARWRVLVSDQTASGKSVAAFCRERGLRDWQFYDWKKRLRRAAASPFLAVQVALKETPEPAPLPTPEPAVSETAQSAGIELRHRRGWSLIVTPGFDTCHLRRLLSVMERES